MRVGFVRLLQKNINLSLSKQEVHVDCHTKRTTNMAEVYWNDAVVFEGTTCIKMHGMQL